MWDLDTIKRINKAPGALWAHVYDLGNGKFALGNRNGKALKVVRRLLTRGRGRPRYTGVRGVRPFIGPEAQHIKPSAQLRAALEISL
jgi:hypothetical protein